MRVIAIRDEDLKRRIDAERVRRGDATAAKTARMLLSERLTQLEYESRTSLPRTGAEKNHE